MGFQGLWIPTATSKSDAFYTRNMCGGYSGKRRVVSGYQSRETVVNPQSDGPSKVVLGWTAAPAIVAAVVSTE